MASGNQPSDHRKKKNKKQHSLELRNYIHLLHHWLGQIIETLNHWDKMPLDLNPKVILLKQTAQLRQVIEFQPAYEHNFDKLLSKLRDAETQEDVRYTLLKIFRTVDIIARDIEARETGLNTQFWPEVYKRWLRLAEEIR